MSSAAAEFASVSRPTSQPRPLLAEWSTAQIVVLLIIVTACIRLIAARALGLGVDESYTVGNARMLAWSYVDYPPLHVWLVGLWSWFWGSESPIVVRLPFILLFSGSTWMMFRLTSRLFDERAGLWAAILLNVAPVFAIPHASWVLPDGPLAFFSLSCACVVATLLFDRTDESNSLAWAFAGLLAGLALLSKYHAAFLVLAVFIFLLTVPDKRRLLADRGPWIAVAVAFLVFLPVVLWNAGHDWIGLSFQAKRVQTFVHPSVTRMLSYIGEQALYLSPWLFVPLALVLARALKRGPSEPRTWLLGLLAVGPIVFFTGASLFARGLPHWPMPGWLFTIPLLGAAIAALKGEQLRWVRHGIAASAIFVLALVLVVASEGATGWLVSDAPAKVAQSDPTLEMLNWSEVKQALEQRELLPEDAAAVAGVSWIEAGKLNYALGTSVPVLCLCSDPQQFGYSQNASDFAGRTILIVESQNRTTRSTAFLAGQFKRLEPLPHITLHRDGRPAMELAVFRGIGFMPGTHP
jgi:hypothetical protein